MMAQHPIKQASFYVCTISRVNTVPNDSTADAWLVEALLSPPLRLEQCHAKFATISIVTVQHRSLTGMTAPLLFLANCPGRST